MPFYSYPEDGKIHSRFSELKRCTPGSIAQVIEERLNPVLRYEGDYMAVGTMRHEEFHNEVLIDRLLPEVFKPCLIDRDMNYHRMEVLGAEEQMSNELFEGMVLHSTMDVYGKDWVADFKTCTAKRDSEGNYMRDADGRYKYSRPEKRQTTIYAIQLDFNKGLKIKKSLFLFEIWNVERSEILGYDCVSVDITEEMIEEAWAWLSGRFEILKLGLQAYNIIGEAS